jgi:predicted nuclease of restriction endonuclease-like RecB superfamily
MLTADHVQVRKKDGELLLRTLDKRQRGEALALANAYLEAAREHVGRTREEVAASWDEIDADARSRRVAAGLRKLVDDGCTFEAESDLDPVEIRRALFRHASAVRRSGTAFHRGAVLAEIARTIGREAAEVDRALFADLRGEHVLRALPVLNAASVVSAYELGQAQAVLLRAVRVTCDVRAASPAALRAFFSWMKFQKLLFSAERREDGTLRVIVDGPFSMFESVTKYGLRFALLLPAMRALDAWSLTADVKWGKDREALVFRLSSEGFELPREGIEPSSTHLQDDAQALLDAVRAHASPWRAEPASTLLDHPGVGLCIPDLVFERDGAPRVYVEVLGFWSRDAVWKRVELAQRGLGAPVVFCASERLRVSAEVLDGDAPAALYVYKGKMNARALLERVERVAKASYPPASPCTSSSPEPRAESAKPSPVSS